MHLVQSLDALDTVDVDRLGLDDAVDAEILQTGLQRELLDLDDVRLLERDPPARLTGRAHPAARACGTPAG